MQDWTRFASPDMLPPMFFYCYNTTKPNVSGPVKFHHGPLTVKDIKALHQRYGKTHHLCIIYDDTLNLMKQLPREQKDAYVGLFSELSRHLNIR